MQRIGAVLASVVLVATTLTACNGPAAGGGGGEKDTVTIAYQPGLGYSPLLIAKQRKVLEKKFPDKKFRWKSLNSG